MFSFLARVMAVMLLAATAQAATIETVATERPLDFYVGPSQNGIHHLDLSAPSAAQQIIPTNFVNNSTGIAVSYYERKLYWIADTQADDVDKIRRSNLDGSDIELFLMPAGQPADVEIDPYQGQLYYSERFTNSINVVPLQGGEPVELVSTFEPRGMDLDLVNGFLYWVEYQDNRLRRARLDGTEVEDVIVSGMTRPFDVTVDPLRERLYWVELGPKAYGGRVWTADLDGANPVLIADQIPTPVDLVIDWEGEEIYWGSDGSLYRADLDGSNVSEVWTPLPGHRNLALDMAAPVPEPSTRMLAGMALLGLVLYGWQQSLAKFRRCMVAESLGNNR